MQLTSQVSLQKGQHALDRTASTQPLSLCSVQTSVLAARAKRHRTQRRSKSLGEASPPRSQKECYAVVGSGRTLRKQGATCVDPGVTDQSLLGEP